MMKHELNCNNSRRRCDRGESGRGMLEIIAVLSIMGLLSIAIAWGYIQASRRETAVTLSDLVTKSVAGVVTSQVLEQVAATYEPVGNGNMLAIGDVIPLDTYISNVGRVSPGSEEERLYGREAFIASRGTVISAYALAQGQGVVVKLNRFSSEVCDILLSSGLDYEGVIDLNNANGKIVPWEDLEDSAVRSELCTPHEAGETLDLGFVFENTGRDPLPAVPCNPACLVDVLGQCALKTEIPCDRGSCDRRDFIVQACEWMCIGKTNQDKDDNCVCPPSMVWDATARECVSCDIYTNGEKPFYQETSDGEGICVECLEQSDCGIKEICDMTDKVCVTTCPGDLVGQLDNSCGCPDNTYPHPTEENKCVECTENNHCDGITPVCDTTNYTCTTCAVLDSTKPFWKVLQDGTPGMCVECLEDADCPMGQKCSQISTGEQKCLPICESQFDGVILLLDRSGSTTINNWIGAINQFAQGISFPLNGNFALYVHDCYNQQIRAVLPYGKHTVAELNPWVSQKVHNECLNASVTTGFSLAVNEIKQKYCKPGSRLIMAVLTDAEGLYNNGTMQQNFKSMAETCDLRLLYIYSGSYMNPNLMDAEHYRLYRYTRADGSDINIADIHSTLNDWIGQQECVVDDNSNAQITWDKDDPSYFCNTLSKYYAWYSQEQCQQCGNMSWLAASAADSNTSAQAAAAADYGLCMSCDNTVNSFYSKSISECNRCSNRFFSSAGQCVLCSALGYWASTPEQCARCSERFMNYPGQNYCISCSHSTTWWTTKEQCERCPQRKWQANGPVRYTDTQGNQYKDCPLK